MKVIYIAGPFRAPSYYEQEQNIRRAESLALEVWKLQHVALCPHLNTRCFQGALPDAVWLQGDLELLVRCDAVLLVDGWQQSTGTTAERNYALAHNIPVFSTLGHLKEWLDVGQSAPTLVSAILS